jgi:hypothetical protein
MKQNPLNANNRELYKVTAVPISKYNDKHIAVKRSDMRNIGPAEAKFIAAVDRFGFCISEF